jgi:hypothetical protein
MNWAPSKQRDWQTHLIHGLVIVKSMTHALCRTPPLLTKKHKDGEGIVVMETISRQLVWTIIQK